jgi:hypothetical protein
MSHVWKDDQVGSGNPEAWWPEEVRNLSVAMLSGIEDIAAMNQAVRSQQRGLIPLPDLTIFVG